MTTLTLKEHIHIGAYCGFTNQLYIYTLKCIWISFHRHPQADMPGDVHLLSFPSLDLFLGGSQNSVRRITASVLFHASSLSGHLMYF